jgi:hypothetical protein
MSVSKKNQFLKRMFLPLELLDDNPENPNEMTDRGFDLLVDNIDQVGFTDPMLVWPKDMIEEFDQFLKAMKANGIAVPTDEPSVEFADALRATGIRFVFVGGHHRRQALQYLGESYGFCTVMMDPSFTEELAEAQLMRNNMIHGRVDPVKFGRLLQRQYDKGLSDDVIQEMYGFAEEAEFDKLKGQLASQLPTKDLQEKFRKAAEEIKTIDGLTKLLNRMFTLYGDTLPYGYLIVDYGGQHSVWLRASKKTFDAVTLIGQACIENQKSLDDVLGYVLQAIARGEAADLIGPALEKSPDVVLEGVSALPTKDNLENMKALA